MLNVFILLETHDFAARRLGGEGREEIQPSPRRLPREASVRAKVCSIRCAL